LAGDKVRKMQQKSVVLSTKGPPLEAWKTLGVRKLALVDGSHLSVARTAAVSSVVAAILDADRIWPERLWLKVHNGDLMVRPRARDLAAAAHYEEEGRVLTSTFRA